MKIVIFNVGAALSSYIEIDGKKIIIDLGKGNDFSPVNDFLIPLFSQKGYYQKDNRYYVDQMILSHPHKDHISDIFDYDDNFFSSLYTTPNDLSQGAETYKNVNWNLIDDPESEEVKKLRQMYERRNLPLQVADPSRMTIAYIYPQYVEDDEVLKSESYTNNIGLTFYIHSGYRIFFAADVQKEGMKKLLDDNKELKKKLSQGVDFLVCPHHGLRSSFSTDLFGAMKNGKTKKLNIVSEKVTGGKDDNRQVDSRYSTAEYCEGENNLSTNKSLVYQRKTSSGHIFIDDDGEVTIDKDIKNIISLF